MPLYPGEIQSDQGNAGLTPWPVIFGQSTTAAITTVAASATSETILAANANRKGATVYNNSGQKLFLSMAASSSATVYTVLLMPNTFFELPFNYTGIISGVWSSAQGDALVTEFT